MELRMTFLTEKRALVFACALIYRVAFSLNPFQARVTFHIETSHLICIANQMTGVYMKYNTGLKWGRLYLHVNET